MISKFSAMTLKNAAIKRRKQPENSNARKGRIGSLLLAIFRPENVDCATFSKIKTSPPPPEKLSFKCYDIDSMSSRRSAALLASHLPDDHCGPPRVPTSLYRVQTPRTRSLRPQVCSSPAFQ